MLTRRGAAGNVRERDTYNGYVIVGTAFRLGMAQG